jgi:hypothetical protein
MDQGQVDSLRSSSYSVPCRIDCVDADKTRLKYIYKPAPQPLVLCQGFYISAGTVRKFLPFLSRESSHFLLR